MMSKCHLTKYPLHVNSFQLNGGYRSVEVLDFSAEFEITRNLHAQFRFIVYEGLSKKDRNLRGHSLKTKHLKGRSGLI